MNEIKINEFTISIPSKWEELTAEDLTFLGERFPFRDTAEFHTQCFAHFLGVKKTRMARKTFKRLSGEDVYDVVTLGGNGHLFRFLFEAPVMRHPVIDGFKIGFSKYVGVSSDMDNMRFDEFRDAERCVAAFLDGGDLEVLNAFIAVIYRKKDNGLRPLYNKLEVDGRAKKIAKLPYKFKMALLLQYIAMRGNVISAFPTIFTREKNTEGTTADWGEILNLMADTIAVKQMVEERLLWDVLEWMKDHKKHKPKPKA